MTQVTRILSAIESGDLSESGKLLSLVYDELRQLAGSKLKRERSDHTLQSTALVHEAYLRLVGKSAEVDKSKWKSKAHFFGAAAEAMRRILIEYARANNAQKRGGNFQKIELEDALFDHPGASRPERLVALDEALTKLESQDPLKAKLVKLRFFAGLTNKQAAIALEISESTADRYWAYARAWLQTEVDDA